LQTSANDVYATGDVAEYEGKVYGIIPAAEEQARIAAINMLEKDKHIYKGTIPSNTLKIVGMDLTSMGIVNPESSKYEEIKRINQEEGMYNKIVLDQGKIVGAIILGDVKMAAAIRRVMDLGTDVSRHKAFLLEEDFDYRKILS
jgi:nitrite reductase (NADH) large subunit